MQRAMSRSSLLGAVAALLLLPACADARGATLATWDRAQQHAVVDAGVMAPLDDGEFHGDRPLSGPQLRAALGALSLTHGTAPIATPDADVSVMGFDALLVEQLGLSDVAAAVQHEAWRAGLLPPPRFGTEVVARLIGLRFNHPAGTESLEQYPWEPVTRAEAAWSLARVVDWDGSQQQWARDTLARFQLPAYTARQLPPLRIAVSKIGMPYVWGGETDRASAYFGGQVHGGYDCSGFAWRVFKLSGVMSSHPPRAIRGRTAASQAGEIRRSERIRLADVHPADLLFFGPGRFWQRATERRIVHEGIALSPDWMIHASAQGVYVSPLFEAWRLSEFSWARRLV
jgi:cell wall-associated NlpC family hydrolase